MLKEFLTDPKVFDKLESNLSYIKDHMDETESVICDELGLYDSLSVSNDLEG